MPSPTAAVSVAKDREPRREVGENVLEGLYD